MILNRFTHPTTWIAPGGTVPSLYLDMIRQPHLLIAGATGSGKSVVINGMISTIAKTMTPGHARLVLIDPKRVELVEWESLPHTLCRAYDDDSILTALNIVERTMMNRYADMERRSLRQWDREHLYVFIDEFADLMTTAKKTVTPVIIRLAQLGRAAGVHLILATQRPTRDIITGQIKVNMDSRLALRVPTSQDSRNIINVSGAELLPRIGRGYYLTPETMQPELWEIPAPENNAAELVRYWRNEGRREA